MGQVCSGAAALGGTTGDKNSKKPRDESDRTLDEIELATTKLADFDAFFATCADPLNNMVKLNNELITHVELILEAYSIVQGNLSVECTVGSGGQLAIAYVLIDEKNKPHALNDEELHEQTVANVEVISAMEKVNEAVEMLNAVEDKDTRFNVVRKNRLVVQQSGAQDDLVRNVNIALFTLKKHLMLMSGESNLKEAMMELVSQLKSSPKITFEDFVPGITFEDTIDGEDIANTLPPRTLGLKTAVEEFVSQAEETMNRVPEMKEKCEQLATEASELPGKMNDAISEAGIGPMDVIPTGKKVKSNVAAVASGPQIAKSIVSNVEQAMKELKDSCAPPSAA